MKPFSIGELEKATKGCLLTDKDSRILNICIDGVSTDTRTIKKGDLYIPLVGEFFDGHNFIDKAVEKGAVALLTHKDLKKTYSDLPIIKVADTLKALQDLAAFQRRRFDIPVIAVTGSNGKTTTKDMIALALSQKYNVLKTKGNLNNEIGLPLTLLGLDYDHEVAVLEMGMNHLGEIHRLADIARPTIGVITNIGLSHIENLGSRENILRAKMEMFHFFSSENLAILNGDDSLLKNVEDKSPLNIKYFGLEAGGDIRAENIESHGINGIKYDIHIGVDTYPMELPIPGKHNVYNSLAAVAVSSQLGVEVAQVAKALNKFQPGAMRLNIFTTDSNIKVVDDVYNASPDSMKASLEILKDIVGKRKVAILGDMLELGDYSEKAHKELGRFVAEKGIDFLITVGDHSSFIDRGAIEREMDENFITHLNCNKDVTKFLDTILTPGDTVLVKGSRGMKMEEIVAYLRNWSAKH